MAEPSRPTPWTSLFPLARPSGVESFRTDMSRAIEEVRAWQSEHLEPSAPLPARMSLSTLRDFLTEDWGAVWEIDFFEPVKGESRAALQVDGDKTYQPTRMTFETSHTGIRLNRLDNDIFIQTPERKDADQVIAALIEYSARVGYDYEILIDFLRKLRLRSWQDYISRLASELQEAFETVCADDADQTRFIAELLANAGVDAPPVATAAAVTLPSQAPALWLERENRKETAPDFIKRVYAPWLGHGLTQAHILHLDKPLYTALHRWLGANEMPADLDLPTKKQMNDRKLAEYRNKGSTEEMSARDYLRLRSAAGRRP